MNAAELGELYNRVAKAVLSAVAFSGDGDLALAAEALDDITDVPQALLLAQVTLLVTDLLADEDGNAAEVPDIARHILRNLAYMGDTRA